MGGVPGYGRVEPEADEPVFHSDWEGRIFGLVISVRDGLSRPRLESLDPDEYLSGYYRRWMLALERGLIDRGLLSAEELEAKTEYFRNDPEASPTRNVDPALTERVQHGHVPTAAVPQDARTATRVRRGRPRASPPHPSWWTHSLAWICAGQARSNTRHLCRLRRSGRHPGGRGCAGTAPLQCPVRRGRGVGGVGGVGHGVVYRHVGGYLDPIETTSAERSDT